MSSPLRSKQGCWTCRLRKKQCDEDRPRCSTCELLTITCYGREQPQRDVKHTSRRKATAQSSNQRDPIISIAPKSLNGSVENSSSDPGPSSQHGPTFQLDHGSSQEDGVSMLQDGSAAKHVDLIASLKDSHVNQDSISPELGDHLMAGSCFFMSADEPVLLMHFLDNVFPLQYPMYKPEILEGGRGWLLALLLRTKPLYRAALALSAYRRRMITLANISHPCQVTVLVQQEKHLEICLKAVNQFTQNSCPNNGLGILTSVVQLVFFELFTGHGNAWQAHFRAARNMCEQGYKKNFARVGLAEKSRTILCEDLPLSEYEPVVAEEVVSFRFLGGTMIWLDITFSVTAGTAPHLLPYHFCVIASNSQTKLEGIIGCKIWVMLQIGRIAALHEHKTQALQQGHLDCTEFEQIVGDISREIQCGLTQGVLEGFNISERDSATMFDTMSDLPTLVTHIFAYMASIYLHLVTRGFQKLEVLDTTISGAMRMLQTRMSVHLLPALVSPLYIIGSVARQGDEQFFRNVLSSPPLLNPSLKHRGRILPILEEIWSRRRTTPGLAWKDSLKLTYDILLL